MMLRTLAVLGSLVLLLGTVTAVVGNNASGDMTIMDGGSSASASQGISPNGTIWTAEVAMTNQSLSNATHGIENISYRVNDGFDTVTFQGVYAAPTPCHTLDHTVNDTGEERYTIQIIADSTLDEGEACADVMTPMSYDTSFGADHPETLTVKHGDETVETITFPDDLGQPPEQPGLLERFLAWLGGLV